MDPLQRLRDNPYYILEVRPEASRADIERAAQRLLGLLDLKLEAASRYNTPLGPQPRTLDKVRMALHELRDPVKRLDHALWARLDPASAPPLTPPIEPARERWPEALRVMGFAP